MTTTQELPHITDQVYLLATNGYSSQFSKLSARQVREVLNKIGYQGSLPKIGHEKQVAIVHGRLETHYPFNPNRGMWVGNHGDSYGFYLGAVHGVNCTCKTSREERA